MTHPPLGSIECPRARAAYPATRVVIGFLFACHGSAALLGGPHLAVHGGPGRVGAVSALTAGMALALLMVVGENRRHRRAGWAGRRPTQRAAGEGAPR